MDFRGKVAVVLGDPAGIGRSTVAALARLGADVVFADTDPQQLEITHDRIARPYRRVLSVRCDVTVAEEIDRLAEETAAIMGPVHILMNNAGVVMGGPYERITRDGVEMTLHLGVAPALRPIQAFVPYMKGRKDSHIILTSSVAGLLDPGGSSAAYIHSNIALTALSEKLADALELDDVRLSLLNYSLTLPQDGANSEVQVADPDEVSGMVIDAIRLNQFLIHTESENDIVKHLLEIGPSTPSLQNPEILQPQ